MSKKLINNAEEVVDEALEGMVLCNAELARLCGFRIVVQKDYTECRGPLLLSGGGAGHEPAQAGYVGKGMLAASVSGSVFASPPPAAILAAIRQLGHGNEAGVLLIVTNYTGDRLNFGLAAERAKAEGIRVEMITVGEDCALPVTEKTKAAGRRGLCGTVLIHKVPWLIRVNRWRKLLWQQKKRLQTWGPCLLACLHAACLDGRLRLR
eukprot:m.179784 g.179784  ORF g.179784 m.179784 type:complete len:208 (+) comp39230_c1_seq10:973-1596(+)